MIQTETVSILSTASRAEKRFSWLTVEVSLWAMILVVALVLRAYNLGWRLMQENEAVQALAAWRFVQGEGTTGTVSSPLLFTLNVIAFALFGGSEVATRLGPALCGLALVILPLGLRRQLGRMGTLITGVVLALSPTALFFSRFVDGGIAVAAGALAGMVGLCNYLEERRPAHLYLAMAGLAVALTAGPGGYTVLLATGSFLALITLWGPTIWKTQARDAWQALRRDATARTAAVVFVAGFVLLSTSFLLHFPGLGQAVDLLSSWLRAFVTAGDRPWYFHLQLLALYEPLALVFGLGGMFYFFLARRSDVVLAFLTWWAVLALVIYLLAGGRAASDVLLIVLPLTLLAAVAVGHLVENACQEFTWDREGLYLAIASGVAVYSYLQWAAYAIGREYDFLVLGLLSLVLLAVLTGLYLFWFGPVPTLRASGLALLVILALVSVSAGLHVTFPRSEDPHEPLVGTPSTTGLRDLLDTLERASLFETGDPRGVEITADQAVGPVLLWYLRDWPAARVVDHLDPSVVSPVVLSLAESEPVVGEKYSGQDFIIQETWRLGNVPASAKLRWVMFRYATSPPEARRVVLWVIARPEETEAGSVKWAEFP
ncbi:MAG: TIGR03663 family protein [Anaerolineae bacterium]|jgi:uncharacterized protein (TIGR03663 family)|nr:TIGR03663 family protein [Anaerolineae bacterium]MDH7472715.1 TIGR03663 family protein [Anaerolineae bacterium]